MISTIVATDWGLALRESTSSLLLGLVFLIRCRLVNLLSLLMLLLVVVVAILSTRVYRRITSLFIRLNCTRGQQGLLKDRRLGRREQL